MAGHDQKNASHLTRRDDLGSQRHQSLERNHHVVAGLQVEFGRIRLSDRDAARRPHRAVQRNGDIDAEAEDAEARLSRVISHLLLHLKHISRRHDEKGTAR